MSLIMNTKVSDGCVLGLWEINENLNYFMNNLILSENDLNKVNQFRNNHRKLEWLSVRALLDEITDYKTSIYYNHCNKPFLSNNEAHISISHSHKLTSVILCKKRKVGIDVEYISNRIQKISHKFVNDSEYINPGDDMGIYHLYIHWCAKEALYKICDKQNLNFKSDIIIEPFEPLRKGKIKGVVIRKNVKEYFNLQYFKKNNYIIVWCIK